MRLYKSTHAVAGGTLFKKGCKRSQYCAEHQQNYKGYGAGIFSLRRPAIRLFAANTAIAVLVLSVALPMCGKITEKET